MRKFCVAVSAWGSGCAGVRLEALATNGRASMLSPHVTWSGPAMTPEPSRSQPPVAALGSLTAMLRVPRWPVTERVVPLAAGNLSLTCDLSSALGVPGEVKVWTKSPPYKPGRLRSAALVLEIAPGTAVKLKGAVNVVVDVLVPPPGDGVVMLCAASTWALPPVWAAATVIAFAVNVVTI